MKADISERVATLEDEVQAMDSMIDARTRRLWQEVETLKDTLEAFRVDLAALRAYIEKGAAQHKIKEVRA